MAYQFCLKKKGNVEYCDNYSKDEAQINYGPHYEWWDENTCTAN